MRTFKLLAVVFLFALSGPSMAQGPALKAGSAQCDPALDDSTGCRIRWDLSAQPRVNYVVQWLNPESGDWDNLRGRSSNAPNGSAGRVASGRLYRVLGCNGQALKENCVSTTAFWAPVVPDPSDIPSSVPVYSGPGRIDQTLIAPAASTHTRVMQLNVYLLADVLGRASTAELPPMTEPLEPGTPGDLAHDVHHNVYASYEAARQSRDVTLFRQ